MGQQTEDTLRVFTAFSGYDSQCLALSRLSIPYDLVGWSEIDPFAIRAHNALFPQWEGRNYGDIAAIDWAGVPDFDLFTYSFPCTDIPVHLLVPMHRHIGSREAARADRGQRHGIVAPMGVPPRHRGQTPALPAHGEC